LLSGSRDCGLDDGFFRREAIDLHRDGRSKAEDGGRLAFFGLREEPSAARRGKKPDAAVARETIGAISPLPLGDTVHRQRPNTCVTDPCKQKNDGERGYLHERDGCWPDAIADAV
jgi:hypothetical protein